MNTKPNAMTWGQFLLWLLGSLIGVVIGFAVFFVVMSGLGSGGSVISTPLASILMTACFGTVIGLAQWSILRRYGQRSWIWIGVTLLGFLICSPILLSLGGNFGPAISSFNSFLMSVPLGYILGIAQWLAIARKIKWSPVWIGVSLVSWVLAGWIGIGMKALTIQMGPILYWIGLFFAGIFLSGVGMLWLFNVKAEPGPSEAAAPVPSVWKRVIRLPNTRLGWWSVTLAVIYVCFLLAVRALSGTELFQRIGTGALWLVMMMGLISWAAGVTGLTAIVEKRERSVIVWIAMVPAAYSLVNTLYNALRMFLGMQ